MSHKLPPVFKSHKAAIVAILFGLIAVIIRLTGLSLDSLWFDEIVSVRTARMGLGEIIRLTSGDVHPALYYLLLQFWIKAFGQTESAVRLLSVCFSALTVFAIYHLALNLFDRRTGFFTALLTTLSPFQVFYAQETRMYAQLAFLATVSIYFFTCCLKGSTRLLAASYVISTSLLLYTHVYAVFVVMAQFLYLVFLFFQQGEISRRRVLNCLTLQFLTGLLFMPWALIILRQATRARHGFWIQASDWLTPIRTLIEYCGSLWLALLLIPLFVYGVKRCSEQTGKDKTIYLPHLRLFLLLWLLLPICAPFFLSKLMTPFYLTKYTIAASLPVYLFGGVGLARLRGLARQAIVLVLIFVGIVAELSHDLTTLKRERWRDAAYNVELAAQPGDLVLFNSSGSYLSFAYYARRKDLNTAVFPYSATERSPSELTLLQHAAAEAFGPVRPLQTEEETKDKLQTIVGDRRRVWIVTRYAEGFSDDFVKAFGNMFRLTTQYGLCVTERRFLFTQRYSATDSATILQQRGLSCALHVYLLER